MRQTLFPIAGLGVWEVVVIAAVVGLVIYLRRRRVNFTPLLVAVPVLAGIAVILYVAANHRRESTGWLMLFSFLAAGGFLLVWAFRRKPRAVWQPGRPTTCPPVGVLKDFLAERLPPLDHSRLAAHLEVCRACQRFVEGLTSEKSWAGMADKLSARPPAAEPALRQVIDRLKEEPEPGATHDDPAPAFAGNLPLGFLNPPEKPGQLGRLERYEVLEEIGRGGMGVVLKAFDPSLHRVVAIKVLAPQLATSGVARQRFLREAKAAAAVTHDHIVTIHAVDEANGHPYLVMQYVAGPSLQQRLDRDGPPELLEILRVGVQTASALAAAHAHGIIHRDIKPANILLEEGVARVKITDFGLARAVDDASLTQSGVVAGSPLYMAPEQARGEALDGRADLFSLGSVLYTLCTGRPPFRAANTLAVLRRVCEDTPRPVREINPEIPDWLAEIVARLMAKAPADRYQSAAEVVEVLGQHLAQLQNGAWSPPPAAATGAPVLSQTVTLCPHCGSSLHVPERMLGGVVHCGSCGKPFRAEGTAEEIRVARPVPSPFPRHQPAVLKALALLLFAFLFILISGVIVLVLAYLFLNGSPPDAAVPAVGDVRSQEWHQPGSERAPQQLQVPVGQDALRWFPSGAVLFGAVDLKPFGSARLDSDWAKSVLRAAVPAGADDDCILEKLSSVRLEGISMAYYEGVGHARSGGVVQLDGQVPGGRQQIMDCVRAAKPRALKTDDNDRGGGVVESPKSMRVSGPDLPFALGMLGGDRVFLARSSAKGGTGSDHLRVLERLPCFDFSSGPWTTESVISEEPPRRVRTALDEIPKDANGFLLGEVPAGWRKFLTEGLNVRASPSHFVASLKRDGEGIALSLTLYTDKPGAELLLQEELERWRLEWTDVLRTSFPSLRAEPEALALLGHSLKTMRWGANPGGGRVSTWVQLPGPTVQALGRLAGRAAKSIAEK